VPSLFFSSISFRVALNSSTVFPAIPLPGLIQKLVVWPVFLQAGFPLMGVLDDFAGLAQAVRTMVDRDLPR
jgi:hypothetical protein